MKLYILMLTFNCINYTHKTLGSIKTNIPHNFIIVDNASTDRTSLLLDDLAKFPNQIIIRNKQQLSVSKSWNIGLKRAMQDAECKYVFVINNDIVFEPYCVDVLVKFVEDHPEYVLVSGFDTKDRTELPSGHVDHKADFCAVLITRACLEKIGYFDENFQWAYFEDNDYHTRVYRSGLMSAIVYDARLYHFGSRTIYEGLTPFERGTQQALYEQNKRYFKQKWGFLPA